MRFEVGLGSSLRKLMHEIRLYGHVDSELY